MNPSSTRRRKDGGRRRSGSTDPPAFLVGDRRPSKSSSDSSSDDAASQPGELNVLDYSEIEFPGSVPLSSPTRSLDEKSSVLSASSSERRSSSSSGSHSTPSSESLSGDEIDGMVSRSKIYSSRPRSRSSSSSSSSSGSSGRRRGEAQLEETNDVSPLGQLFAVLVRRCSQMIRSPLTVILEVLVPVVFVVISVILWSMFGTESFDAFNPLEASEIATAAFTVPTGLYTCQTAKSVEELGVVIPTCSVTMEKAYICDGDMSQLPFSDGSVCRNPNVTYAGLVVVYTDALVGNVSRVPSLHDMLVMQAYAQMDVTTMQQLTVLSTTGMLPMSRYNSILTSGNVYFVGDSGVVAQLIKYMMNQSSFFRLFHNPDAFATVADARAARGVGERVWAIVELRECTKDSFHLVLHMNKTALPPFTDAFDYASPGGAIMETADMFLASGFLTLQQVVSEFYMEYFDLGNEKTTMFVSSTPYPSYKRIPILLSPRQIVPLIFAVAYLYNVSQQTKRIVLEKEMRIREAVLIMGLKEWTLYVSDFLIQLAVFALTALLSTVLLKATYLYKGDVFVLFLIFFLFGLTLIPLSGFMAAFFSKARLASMIAPVIYFILVIPTFAMSNASGGVLIGFSFLSPSAFATAMNIFLFHGVGEGFNTSQYHAKEDNPNMAVVIGIMAADFFIYYLLMLYLDAVMPQDWGTPKHPLFFIIDPVRHCCCARDPKKLDGGEDGRSENGVFETVEYGDDAVYIAGLRKEFRRGGKTFVAVNNLYWGMQGGEISVLLGHNGAGKTTVLNMMTGMIEADEGDCYLNGLSVRTQLGQVRKELGYCPQHNILWPELTCRDHLEFFARIKGLKGWALEDAVCRMLYETDLLDKMDEKAGGLSGGMKRKLSIAISFVGGSSLVFLDEPTAGLDVGARRYVWELLKRMSSIHTMLLTTHYMDEADLLGSRIGIMSQGSLKCSGSSLFLKSRLGVGYNIVISVDPEIELDSVDRLVLSRVTGAKANGRNGTELTYQLPTKSVAEFPAFLNEVDKSESSGIRGYTFSATTLEEVFLNVSEEDLTCRSNQVTADELAIIWNSEVYDSVWKSQFRAMMAKRFWNAMRDRRMMCFQIICPVACILIAMLLNLINFRGSQYVELNFDEFTTDGVPTLHTTQCAAVWGTDTTPYPNVNLIDLNFPSAQDVANYELDGWYAHSDMRLGGISCRDYLFSQNVSEGTSFANVLLHNTSSHNQAAINMALYYDMVTKKTSGSSSHAMTYTAQFFEMSDTVNAMSLIFMGALILMPLCFLPSNPVAWIVKERECGARHMQDLCGLNFYVYWATNFLFDMAGYFISMMLIIVIFAIFNRKEFIGADRFGGTFVLLLVYGLTSTVAAYALSFCFSEHSSAQTTVMALSLVLGFLFLIIVYVLLLQPSLMKTSDNLRWVFRIIPSFCVGEGVTNLLMLQGKLDMGTAKGVWDMGQLGWPIVYMAIEFPLLCLTTLLIDHPSIRRFFQSRKYDRDAQPILPEDEDPDVRDEREAVYEADDHNDGTDMVRVIDLQKKYGNGHYAVKGITFSIFPCEVFGFLGTNGAGKTTTMSMLCQKFLPTGGHATIGGYDLVSDSREALHCLGYCPQFDATLDLLTVEEQLHLYAGIRGIVKEDREAVVSALCTLCELGLYRKTVTSKLSGGNRRKVSVAMSLINGPRVVFLDEPSAGMDPVARRGMWTAIQRASKFCPVVLTTHHLEEIEALADIVAIMVQGSIRCIGDKVHLKNKYGSAFELSARLGPGAKKKAFEKFMKKEFPGCIMNEGDGSRYVYQLTRDRQFGDIFDVLQQKKVELCITDYSVSQTSIEQVFLRVAEDAKGE